MWTTQLIAGRCIVLTSGVSEPANDLGSHLIAVPSERRESWLKNLIAEYLQIVMEHLLQSVLKNRQ